MSPQGQLTPVWFSLVSPVCSPCPTSPLHPLAPALTYTTKKKLANPQFLNCLSLQNLPHPSASFYFFSRQPNSARPTLVGAFLSHIAVQCRPGSHGGSSRDSESISRSKAMLVVSSSLRTSRPRVLLLASDKQSLTSTQTDKTCCRALCSPSQ